MGPSRRLCNLPYVVLILGLNALVLGSLAAVDLFWPLLPRLPLPDVYAGVQESMLVAFLLANLLTGLVNVSGQPLLMSSSGALLVMTLYSLSFLVPLGILQRRGVALK